MLHILYILVGVLLSTISSQYIFGGDSAEFSAVAHTWSIPHPPGYPLYSFLLNCITSLVPFGTIPWKASLLSVVPMVISSYFIFKILTILKVRGWISFSVSLLYIVLYPVWEYTLVPEVFALNSMLVMGITYSLIRYGNTRRNIYLYLSSFMVGLCVSHHHIFVIFIPGWILLIRDKIQTIIKSKTLFFSILFLSILGASFYIYVPIASYFNPPIQWEDSKTFLGFWRLITRAMYGTFTAYGGSKGDIVNQLYDVFSVFLLIFQDFRMIGLGLIIIGFRSIKKMGNTIFPFLLITSISHLFFLFYTNFMLSSSFSIGMFERFLISFYALLVIYLGVGFEFVYFNLTQWISRLTSRRIVVVFSEVCLVFILVIYIGTIIRTNYRSISYIKNGQDFDRLGMDIINTVPSGSIFFAGNDNANFTTLYQFTNPQYNSKSVFFQINFMHQEFYYDQFKKKNKDLKFPTSMKGGKSLEQFITLNKKRGIYLETPLPFGFWMPYGLLWKYYPSQKEALTDLPNLVKATRSLWKNVYHIPDLNSNTRNILHLQAIQDFYIESYILHAKVLYYAKENSFAQEVMRQLLVKFRPSNTHIRLTLMNMVLQEPNCKEAEKIADTLLIMRIDSLNDEYVSPLLSYYTVCDPTNTKLLLLKKKRENAKNKSLAPLDSF